MNEKKMAKRKVVKDWAYKAAEELWADMDAITPSRFERAASIIRRHAKTAAAPDLLEAMKELLDRADGIDPELCCDCDDDDTEPCDVCKFGHAVDQARAAIKKAQG